VVFLSAWITIAINQLQLKSEDPFHPCSEQIAYQIMNSVFMVVMNGASQRAMDAAVHPQKGLLC
jgi:hypothetical protein